MREERTLQASNYIIYVPYSKNREKYILVHGYTGAVDLVEREIAEYLLQLRRQGHSRQLKLPDLPLEVIARLTDRGYLTTRSPEEEQAYLCQLGEALHRRQRTSKSTFFFCPSYKCQLRCSYCFELWLYRKGSEYMGRKMSPEVIEAAFDAIHRIQPNPERVGEITLFGGEPLLAENVDIVSYILEHCRRNGFSQVVAVTNGVELESYLHLLGAELGKIRALQITLDGPPELHDKRRHGPSREGSFEAIVANVPKALDTGAIVTIRTNVDHANLEHIDWLARFYHEKGWSRKPNFGAYCQVVFNGARKGGLAISRLKLAEIIEQKRKEYPHVKFMSGSFGVARVLERLLDKGPLQTFHPTFCGANNDMYVFDAWGDIFACTEAAGEISAKVGSYYPEFVFISETLERFQNRTIMQIPICRKCPWALLCGGGCMEHAKESMGDYYTNFCAQYQALFVKLVPEAYQDWLKSKQGADLNSSNLVKHPGA